MENKQSYSDDSPMSQASNHSEEDDDRVHEDFDNSEGARKFADDSSPPDSDSCAQNLAQYQQRELLEKFKEQFNSFPFHSTFSGLDYSEQNQQLEGQIKENFPFSFPTPPHKDDIKISSSSKKVSSSSNQQNNSWSYEDQFKQVRQLYEINEDPKRKEFLDDLFQFMKERGTPINRLPIMAKSVLDLYELYKLVIARGGLVNVINKKLWQEIIKDLNLPSSITSAAFTLRTQYTKYLYPYESEKYNLSSKDELQAAIENNKRDGSRRSTSNNYSQFAPHSPQQQMQLQAMAASMNPPTIDMHSPDPEQQLNDMQQAQQKFMMMMFLYNHFLQQQGST